MKTGAGALHRLKDSELRLADVRADIRGCRVVDMSGDELGRVGALLIDDHKRKVRFIQVETGGFLGLGKVRFLLPIETVVEVRRDLVRVAGGGERGTRVLIYDPELVERMSPSRPSRREVLRRPGSGVRYPHLLYPGA